MIDIAIRYARWSSIKYAAQEDESKVTYSPFRKVKANVETLQIEYDCAEEWCREQYVNTEYREEFWNWDVYIMDSEKGDYRKIDKLLLMFLLELKDDVIKTWIASPEKSDWKI